METGEIVVASRTASIDNGLLREIRGPFLFNLDKRVFTTLVLSILIHGFIVYLIYVTRVPETSTIEIEKIPERFAKLIIDKPMPKTEKIKKNETKDNDEKTGTESKEIKKESTGTGAPTVAERTAAKASVAKHVTRVEQKIRTVGVLGLLTGVGPSAKGPAAVDVLADLNDGKESHRSLEDALSTMTGLKKTNDISVLDKKLVRSKDVSISHKEDIDDLIAGVYSL